MLPDTLTTIGDRAFYDTGLGDIAIPDGVTSIGRQAFGYYVERFTIGDPIEHRDSHFVLYGERGGPAERYALEYGMRFEELEQSFKVVNVILTGYHGNYGLVRIPDQVTEIGDDAFRYYQPTPPYVCTVVVPDVVTRIGNNAFFGCTDLQFLYLTDSLTEIGYRVFYQCRSLREVTIPACVTKIGRYALGFYRERWEAWDNGKESEFTICGERNSAAECYARECGFTLVAV